MSNIEFSSPTAFYYQELSDEELRGRESTVPTTFLFTQLNGVVTGINTLQKRLNSETLNELLSNNNFLPDGLTNIFNQRRKSKISIKTYLKLERKSQRVVQILRKIFVTKFILIGFLKVISVILLFAIPVVMNILTNEVRKFADKDYFDQNLILELSAGLLVITFFQAVIDTQYSYQIIQLEMQSKVYLYETLYFSAMSRKGVISKNNQSSDLLTLINIDIGTIVNFFISFHECWSLILKLMIGLTLLYLQMKHSIFIGFATAFLLMIINFWVATKIGNYYQRGLVFKDRRMELLREFITYPKQIKFLKWENSWFQKIIEQRIKEFKVISGSKWLDSMCVFFWSITNTLISTATISYFVMTQGGDEEQLQTQDIFTMIYLFNLITNPLNSLPWTVSGMLQAKISFSRVDKYLLEPEEFNNFENQIVTFPQTPLIIENMNLFQFYQARYGWQPKYVKKQKEEETLKVFPEENKTSDYEFILQIDQLAIQSKKLYIIIGPTAGGKTAFVNTLMKEMYQYGGYQNFKYEGDVALVPQSHWVSQTSIRGNITFEEKNFYYESYIETIQRTELLQDILNYEKLDMFNAGPEGNKLSGGQKQRLALCRALYNEQDLYILDDPFSSLDPSVADKIFQNAILEYLVKSKGKSVILVLNDSFLNKYAKYADQLILVKKGIVTTDAKKIQDYISKNIPQQDSEQSYELLKQEENVDNKKIQEFKESLQIENKEIEEEQDDSNMNTKASIKLYLKQLGAFNLLWITISVILMQFSFNFYDAWLNSYLNDHPFFLIKDNFTYTIIVITTFDLLIKIMRAVSFCYGNLKQAFSIFMIQAKKVIFGKASFFDKEESGQVLSRLVGDQNVVDNQFPFELNILCNNIVNFFGTFILLIYLQWQLVFPTFIALIMFYQIQQKYRPTSLPLRRLEAQTSAQLTTQINDQFKGVKVIVAFNKSRVYFKIFMKQLKNHLRVAWTSKCAGLWLQVRLQMVATFIVLCLLILTNISISFQQLQINIPPSTLQLLLYYTLTKISLFRDLTLSMTTCERELISYERIRHYMEYREENLNQNNQIQNLDIWDIKQPIIKFDNLSLDYAFQPELFVSQQNQINYQKSALSLNQINFSILPGKMVAFCGRTGSGKSSILSMIFQLYQKCDGQILLKNRQLENMIDWRQKISVIPQNGLVFKGTIEENLINSHINENQKSRLDQYIKSCPIKIDLTSQVDTDGKNISQGVKQVISFLRVILEDQDIICLDEATASVDQKVEEWVLLILIDLCKIHGKTIIYISHRLETLDKFDEIYYLENGQILEQGTFQELISDQNSKFNKLRSQNTQEDEKIKQ